PHAALKRSQPRIAAGVLRGLESDSGKAQVLARGQIYHGDPGHYQKDLKILRQATPDEVQTTANQWLQDGVFVLSVKPFGSHQTHTTHVDRSQLPDIGPAPDLKLPSIEKATLSNGLKIRLAEQHETPIVDMNLVFNAGYAADRMTCPVWPAWPWPCSTKAPVIVTRCKSTLRWMVWVPPCPPVHRWTRRKSACRR